MFLSRVKRYFYILSGALMRDGKGPILGVHCNACGKMIGTYETPKIFIMYKRPTVYLCFSCKLAYEEYTRLCDRLNNRKEVFDILYQGNTS